VTELRLNRALYPRAAVDAAVLVYAPYGALEVVEEQAHWVVRVTAASRDRERRIAGQLGNYSLGLSATSPAESRP
jgi:hypothetical protein